MKTLRFFWFYFKKYKLSFTVIALMIILATYLQVKAPVYLGQALTELAEWAGKYAKARAISQATGAKMVLPKLTAFNSVMFKLLLAYSFTALATLVYSLLFSRIISYSTNQMRKGLLGNWNA